ncbi:MAG: adenosine deaminase [Alphaproteobacteria bacterium]|nr:adenosine deaminase [Alphaproteobacteria bacterium]
MGHLKTFFGAGALIFALGLAGASAAGPDLSAMSAGERIAFTKAMPKGGELHNHISGAVFPETLLAWAAEDGRCVDVATLALAPPPCDREGLRPAAEAIVDGELYSDLLDSFSTRQPGFLDRSGHDQFFGVFDRIGGLGPGRAGDMLAVVMDDLAHQNTFYLEAMITPQGGPAAALGLKVGLKDDLGAMKAEIDAAGLPALVSAAIAGTDALEARARQVLACGTPAARPGCQVTVRYLVQTIRVLPPEATFAQLQLGVALVQADPRWVGLQMVAPEDHPTALANYSLHMEMVGFLTGRGQLAPVALHAGELTFDYAPPEHLRDHIAQAVRIAGARRIGHGVGLPHEMGAEALAAEMARNGVLVEVNLTSNAVILELGPDDHPYEWLRERGVPVSLSTDDAGLLRIDLSHEYERAHAYGATYDDLKRSARNALAFSFLAGEGLWSDPGLYRRPVGACRRQVGAAVPRGACAVLVESSDKAREQWRHEALLAAFEAAQRSAARR